MKTIKKTELLPAMRKVLAEYRENKHRCTMACPLCELYNSEWDDCFRCPMSVFNAKGDNLACLSRRCVPVDCEDKVYKGQIKLQAVQEFYEKVIAKVETMTYDELNKTTAFLFLKDIDHEVADKHDLYMSKKKKMLIS